MKLRKQADRLSNRILKSIAKMDPHELEVLFSCQQMLVKSMAYMYSAEVGMRSVEQMGDGAELVKEMLADFPGEILFDNKGEN